MVANSLGARPETVRMWMFRGKIPRSSWPDLMIAFPQVSLADLVGIEGGSSGDVAIKSQAVNNDKLEINGSAS